jgi:cation transport ATPase
MGENEINHVTEENDIGILIDDKLKFQQHINQQTKQSKPKTWNDKKKFQLHGFLFLLLVLVSYSTYPLFFVRSCIFDICSAVLFIYLLVVTPSCSSTCRENVLMSDMSHVVLYFIGSGSVRPNLFWMLALYSNFTSWCSQYLSSLISNCLTSFASIY